MTVRPTSRFSSPGACARSPRPLTASVSHRVIARQMAKPPKQKPVEGAQFVRYFGPLLDALRELGGSGTPDEVVERICDPDRRCSAPAHVRETTQLLAGSVQ
jgi:hypothetical protein